MSAVKERMVLKSTGSLFFCVTGNRHKDNSDALFAVMSHLPPIHSLHTHLSINPRETFQIFESWSSGTLFRPWHTLTSSQPLRQVSTPNHQNPGPESPRWTCCCCCCCAQPCGWAATDKELAGPAGPSCADASAASTAADVPPYNELHGSRSDACGHLDKGQESSDGQFGMSLSKLPIY